MDAEVTSLSTAVTAQLRTYIVTTVTLHGAPEATITYVDVSGLQQITLNSSGEYSNVTITCLPTNPYVTFVDSNKSKCPEDLTQSYFRRYEITSATTDIYVMPDNSLYWYGYDEGVEDMSNANGWTNSSGYSFVAPTHNKNNISFVAGSSKFCGVGSKNTKTITNLYSITNGTGGSYLGASSAKNHNLSPVIAKFTLAVNGVTHGISGCSDTGTSTMYALYYDATTPTTPTYYSAACDVLYIKDSSDNIIPIAYTDSEGKCYDAISLPNGTYTIYSSVAKNPDNLSQAYSKSVTITSATTEIRVMPSNVLYWYGFNSDVEALTSTNGWSFAGFTLGGCTFNKNSVTFPVNANLNGMGTTNSHSTTKIHYVGTAGTSYTLQFYLASDKNIKDHTYTDTTSEQALSDTLSYGYAEYSSARNGVIYCRTGAVSSSVNMTVNALWYE